MKSKALFMSIALIGLLSAVGTLSHGATTISIPYDEAKAFKYETGLAAEVLLVAPAITFSPAFMSLELIITPAFACTGVVAEPAVIPAKAWKTVFHRARDAVS